MQPRALLLLAAASVGLLPAVLACGCCERNATLSECGPGSELRARPDCECCSACARLRGQDCNDSDRPCAEGLDCGSERVCTGETIQRYRPLFLPQPAHLQLPSPPPFNTTTPGVLRANMQRQVVGVGPYGSTACISSRGRFHSKATPPPQAGANRPQLGGPD